MTYQQNDDNQGGSWSGNDRGGSGGGFRGRSGGGGGFNRAPRQMVDVSAMGIKCANCGNEIKELPFQPDPARLNTILCRDCLRKNRPPRRY